MIQHKKIPGILLSYFTKQEDAGKALKKLKKKGFHNIALLPKTTGGDISSPNHLAQRRWANRKGVSKVLDKYAQALVSNETVLVIRAPMDAFHTAITVLREGDDIPPAVFILHAKAAKAPEEARNHGVPLSPEQICERAKHLANEHGIDPKPKRNA
ncbi:MAG: hypothetical protein LLF89_04735, partial [Spirochaetaceae bacterium]|nr:hypothetical protein [Spirochaetaceae bacterium]